MWICCEQPKRLFSNRNSLEPYMHTRGSYLHNYIIHSALAPADFMDIIRETAPPVISEEIEYALSKYMRVNGSLYQHTVVILVDDVWAGRFIIDENMFPHTLVLDLE